MGPIFADDRIDTIPILYGIRSITNDHIWVLTRGMDMHMPKSENGLEDARDLCIDLLDTIESTLTHSSREWRYLIDTDDPLICDDEEVELVVHPW